MAARYNAVVATAHGAQWCIVVHDNNAANVLRGKTIERPSFAVGRPGIEAKRQTPARKDRPPPPAGRSAKASRTLGNLIRFLSGRPISCASREARCGSPPQTLPLDQLASRLTISCCA